MKIILELSIQTKIQKMKARVLWKSNIIESLGIDQTCFELNKLAKSCQSSSTDFSFLVIGDSGSRSYYNKNPQRQVSEAMLAHSKDCRFILHTGDVVYLVGSREQYPKNFIEPYRELLVGGSRPEQIAYDRMCFRIPFLPVLGNHDYYDFPFIFGLLLQLAAPLRRLLRSQINLDLGWHGSFQGDAYARAFLDYLADYKREALIQHLQQHYTGSQAGRACLVYQPGKFTRLPNRYYQFRQGGIDFFALDSNTFNAPLPLGDDAISNQRRQALKKQLDDAGEQEQSLVRETLLLDGSDLSQAERLEDNNAKLEQIREQIRDIEKQLGHSTAANLVDHEQLDWLIQRLVASWKDSDSRGRIVYFHHPPYVTEISKWNQGQTLAIRHNLRQALDSVEALLSNLAQKTTKRSIVDLVICGHAHCLEHLQTGETGHGDRNTHWLVCGGSGFSLRRQRSEGNRLLEKNEEGQQVIAESKLFVGRSEQGRRTRRPYSFLRIDVSGSNTAPKYHIYPQIVERLNGKWTTKELPPTIVDLSKNES